jgi:hypothetical protein
MSCGSVRVKWTDPSEEQDVPEEHDVPEDVLFRQKQFNKRSELNHQDSGSQPAARPIRFS